jgi:AGZA family xanthine/uracil permease-like MFS transporter
MPWGGVFLATIIAAIIGTLVMGLFANVPYAQAAGMGLNAFFTYTVCFGLGFKWQETLCMVFLCGLINILITVTKIRKMIIQAIPEVLQNAIGGGIGLFVAYVGFLNVGFFTFTTKSAAKSGDTVQATPGLAVMNNPTIWLFIIGLVLAIVLTVLKVRGGMLIAIAVTAVVGIPMGQTTMANSVSIADTFAQLPQTFGVIFTKDGFPALFSDVSKLPIILLTIFAFSMSDTFDTIGTFIGTGRRTGIFSAEDEKALENGSGFSSKMDKALFADSIATFIGAICGTSNTTTYVESSAGIAAGGFLATKRAQEQIIAVCITFGAGMSLLLASGVAADWAILPFMALMGAGVGIAGPSRDLLVRKAATKGLGEASFGRVYGFVYSGLDTGLATAPLIFGAIMDGGKYPLLWVGVAVFQVLAVFSALRVGRNAHSAHAESR